MGHLTLLNYASVSVVREGLQFSVSSPGACQKVALILLSAGLTL